ncbi:hypothetical protein BHM03_00059507 [Ensete ventricosum]|nr:hypothetical protein BHM03_00059507 [Ensete ventricosum]
MGKKGELLDVMAGLYRNFLPPTGKAQFVTPLLLKCATRCFSSSPLSSFQSSNCNTTLSSEVEIDLVCMSGNGEIQRLDTVEFVEAKMDTCKEKEVLLVKQLAACSSCSTSAANVGQKL